MLPKIEDHQESSRRRPPKKKVQQQARDEQGSVIKALTKEQFSIYEVARQLVRDSA